MLKGYMVRERLGISGTEEVPHQLLLSALYFSQLKISKQRRVLHSNMPITVNECRSAKTILLWNIPPTVSYSKIIDQHCGQCVVTTDRKMFVESDAVVIYFKIRHDDLPDPALR